MADPMYKPPSFNLPSKFTGSDNPAYDFGDARCFADLADHMGFNRANILKSVLRWDEKNSLEYELDKIAFYVGREVSRLQGGGVTEADASEGLADAPEGASGLDMSGVS